MKRNKKAIIKKTMITIGLILITIMLVEGFLLWRLDRQRSDYKKYWQAKAAAVRPDNAQVYVALGDSAAQGIGASNPKKGYVGIVADRIAKKTGRPVHVVNLSVTGARVADVTRDQLPRFQMLDLPPDAVITLEIGSNNMKVFQAESFRREFDELLRALPRRTIVADLPYFGCRYMKTNEFKALEASQIVSELVAKYNMKLVNLHKVTKETNSWFNYAADFFHPNDRAYRIWADVFWSTIENQL